MRITTDSWRNREGKLYRAGSSAYVSLPSLKVTRTTMVITEVTFRKDAITGTTCELTLMHRAGLVPQPTLPPWNIPAEAANLPPGLAKP